MIKWTFYIILASIALTSCNGQQSENEKITKTTRTNMTDENFEKAINEIKSSDIYENPDNWEARGLNPSDQSVIKFLRKSTNDFLDKLEKIYYSDESAETKLTQVSKIVDELPWDELDTEEREFMADTLAPAIKAAGFDPWTIF